MSYKRYYDNHFGQWLMIVLTLGCFAIFSILFLLTFDEAIFDKVKDPSEVFYAFTNFGTFSFSVLIPIVLAIVLVVVLFKVNTLESVHYYRYVGIGLAGLPLIMAILSTFICVAQTTTTIVDVKFQTAAFGCFIIGLPSALLLVFLVCNNCIHFNTMKLFSSKRGTVNKHIKGWKEKKTIATIKVGTQTGYVKEEIYHDGYDKQVLGTINIYKCSICGKERRVDKPDN